MLSLCSGAGPRLQFSQSSHIMKENIPVSLLFISLRDAISNYHHSHIIHAHVHERLSRKESSFVIRITNASGTNSNSSRRLDIAMMRHRPTRSLRLEKKKKRKQYFSSFIGFQ